MTLTVIATSMFLLLQAGKGFLDGVVLDSSTSKPISGAYEAQALPVTVNPFANVTIELKIIHAQGTH